MTPLLPRLRSIVWMPLSTAERRRTTLTMALVYVAYLVQFRRALPMHPTPGADGFFSWAYAMSLAFDGDLELTNEYTICGHPEGLVDEGGGRPSNPFYFGPALIWTPILFVVRHIVRLPAEAPAAVQHACTGTLTRLVGSTSPFFTTLTIWLAYRVARRWVKQPYALAGALIGAFGTTLVTYGGPMWFYSHMWAALGVALVMFTFVRATERPERAPRWVLFGMAVALAALMRPQEGVWIVLGVVWLIATVRDLRWTAGGIWSYVKPAVLWTAGFASVYWIQLLVYKKLYGVYWLVPQGKLYLQIGHAHPFLMLFNPYSGWFTWTPLVWLGVLGVLLMLFSQASRVMGFGLLVAGALDVYVASAALSWHGGGTFGQRILTCLAPAVAVGAAVFSQRLGELIRRRRGRTRFVLIVAIAFPLLFVNWGMPWVWNPIHTPAAYSAAVGKNFEDLDKLMGDPFGFPATTAFSLRYHVPQKQFDALSTNQIWARNYRTAAVENNIVLFATPPPSFFYAEGIQTEPTGARISGGHGRMLLTIYWPWVTHIRLLVQVNGAAGTKATLRLVANGFFVGKELGSKTYAAPKQDLEWSLPPWGLDSGLNELEVFTDADVTLERLEFIDRTPHDLSLH